MSHFISLQNVGLRQTQNFVSRKSWDPKLLISPVTCVSVNKP